MQFYATVYFETGSDCSFVWRSGGSTLRGSMADLASITGYTFFPVPQDDFATVVQHSRTKEALAFAYKPGTPDSMVGTIRGLLPKYAALHQILCTSLAPNTGSSDMLWCTTIDLLIYAHEGRKVDVLNFMYEEMKSCVFDKKSCVVSSVHSGSH